MSKQEHSEDSKARSELPIERGFPIERVNEIAQKEGRAKQHYRPVYTMHKWWARRPGCLFRAITLYSLLDGSTEVDDIEIYEPGENQTLGTNGLTKNDLINAISDVSMEDPEPLWDFYSKDVRVKNKKILDPFMGGGTSLVEASRFGIESKGVDLNPVAWFVTKKQLEAGKADISELENAFAKVESDVSEEILEYYRTPCPNGNHDADVMYNFWVKELDCVSCGFTVPLFKDYRIAAGRYENDDKYNVICPDCGTVTLVDDWQEESQCTECSHSFVPKEGNVTRGGYYNCPECGQKESITDAIKEQGKAEMRLCAVEYYCSTCDQEGRKKSEYKGYKKASAADKNLFEQAKRDWNTRTDLHKYVPDEEISEGAITAASSISGNDVFQHGLAKWTDMFNERQLLALSTLLKAIDDVPAGDAKEYLLLAFSETLNYVNMMSIYQPSTNKGINIFKSNSFDPPARPIENNPWGTEFGAGNFKAMWDMVKKGVEYAHSPTERYIVDGKTKETAQFAQNIGSNSQVHMDDMRELSEEDEYDAVITDPPYYDNIIYSEVADYFYVWQKILLDDVYPGFDKEKTPRVESIVTNPYLGKTAEDFEHEMGQALAVINRALKDNGTLVFTYHHSDEESWGELLESLCENEFEVTATYPINSDLHKFIGGESVSFDIVIVARPTEERTPISWRRLRIDIMNRLDEIQAELEENRDLAEGDIGVIEMGACFSEYSKHHGEVRRGGNIMTAKEAVQEIYGIIQDNALGEQDLFLSLRRSTSPSYNDFNKLLRRSEASEEEMRDKALFRMDGDNFILGDWNDEKRQAYVRSKVSEATSELSVLDKAHFLRYRYEEDKSTKEYLKRWNSDDLQELCEGLAEATGDETYLKMLGVHNTNWDEFTNE
jgi:adenine-specific DNA methylase